MRNISKMHIWTIGEALTSGDLSMTKRHQALPGTIKKGAKITISNSLINLVELRGYALSATT